MVQAHAMKAWREGLNFRELILEDKEITRRVPRTQLDRAFELKRQLRNIDKIFARVFQENGKPRATSSPSQAGSRQQPKRSGKK